MPMVTLRSLWKIRALGSSKNLISLNCKKNTPIYNTRPGQPDLENSRFLYAGLQRITLPKGPWRVQLSYYCLTTRFNRQVSTLCFSKMFYVMFLNSLSFTTLHRKPDGYSVRINTDWGLGTTDYWLVFIPKSVFYTFGQCFIPSPLSIFPTVRNPIVSYLSGFIIRLYAHALWCSAKRKVQNRLNGSYTVCCVARLKSENQV